MRGFFFRCVLIKDYCKTVVENPFLFSLISECDEWGHMTSWLQVRMAVFIGRGGDGILIKRKTNNTMRF